MYRNYAIKSSKGVFYTSQKEKDTLHTVEIQTQEHGTRYHHEVNTVGGVLTGAKIEESPFGGKQVKLFLEDGEDINVVQMNIFDGEAIESWVKELCKFLPNFDLGEKYFFSLNRKKTYEGKGGKTHLWRNMYVNVNEERGEKNSLKWAEELKDKPAPEERTARDGSVKKDYTKQDDFYWALLQREVDRLAYQADNAGKPQEAAVEAPAENYDSLPF